ncbi:hypothetical protein FHL15_000891 [Xylaria flabelliformis]|uniref:F-box domain-containing protein n=1 Tax=Xylaria flabelliformis TaxID=2512241 RepID=A0A553IDH8_9PEZI|nr:hypothetical protein FHL15_000891 [Xylaria flabelliformis]
MLHIPYEIVAQIASNERLSRQDLAAMRLVCRFFTVPVTTVLFRQVNMSRLRADRDSFEHIAASEHLARHVRELVWHELDLEDWEQPKISEISTSCDDFVLICDLMAGASWDTDLFWFPRTPLRDLPDAIYYLPPDEWDKQRDHKPLSDYRNFARSSFGWFVTTLDKFTNLTTLISRPMPRGRVITYKEYPIGLDLYMYQQRSTTYRQTFDTGFAYCELCLAAIKRVGSNVRTLSRQDELHKYRTSFRTESLPKHITGFEALTTIDLCLASFHKEQYEKLVLRSKAATNLKHLSLCLDSKTYHSKKYYRRVYGFIESYTSTTLTSLELSHVWFKLLPMVSFLNRCTGIRHLALRNCIVMPADMLELREKSSCQLTSISITGKSSYSYPESNLLDFVNRRSSVLLDSDGNPMDISNYHQICTELPNGDDSTPTSSDTEEEEESTLNHPWYWEEPYWSWGKFGPSHDVYCWQVDDEDKAQAGTTIWSFKDCDGEILYGDPLDYYSDIDSEDGLEITPLPWGFDFFRGSKPFIPDTEPPPGAIRYDEQDYAIIACHEVIFQ